MGKVFLITGVVFSFLFVALGAFGSHSLKEVLDAYGKSIWEKAVLYHMAHAIALILVGFLQNYFKEINFNLAGYLFIAGIVLFSGSLYVLAVTRITALGMVTPLGGLCFLAGWGWLVYCFSKFTG
jgi:uncharacterized membrane protein YgdD (TMEM256/DUF423 family)